MIIPKDDLKLPPVRLEVFEFITNSAIQWRGDGDLMPLLYQCPGKARHHIGQSAGLGVRVKLAGRLQDPHGLSGSNAIGLQVRLQWLWNGY